MGRDTLGGHRDDDQVPTTLAVGDLLALEKAGVLELTHDFGEDGGLPSLLCALN